MCTQNCHLNFNPRHWDPAPPWFLQPESRWDFLSHLFLNQSISKNVVPNLKPHNCEVQTPILEVTYIEALLCHITKILWVGFYSLHQMAPTALDPGETFSVFFLDPVQRISTRSYVSQCQLIYSVITTAISLILGLFPEEILLLMCFCQLMRDPFLKHCLRLKTQCIT